MPVCNYAAGNHTIQISLKWRNCKIYFSCQIEQFPLDLAENSMFLSVDSMFLSLRTSQKALCPGHKELQELLYKLSDPCSKLSKACQAFGYIILSIFGSPSIQTFENSVGESLPFLGNRVSGLDFTSICGWYSFNHLSFQMRRCCRISNLSVNKYFIKIGTDI